MSKRSRTKYSSQYPFKNLTKKDIDELLYSEVFGLPHFKEHVKEVSFKTKISEEIVEAVLVSYFTNIMRVLNTSRKVKTKINIFAFLSLVIAKGQRI